MAAEFQPYVGPKSFEEKDRKLFFGRDAEANDLFSLIVAHQVVLVYAQSGAGKTSLLNARIIPSLKEKGYEVLPLARVQGIQADDESNIFVFNTLQSWANGHGKGRTDLQKLSLAKFLKDVPHVQRLKESSEEPPESEEEQEPWELPRIAVFDQFEELFTSYPHRWQEREAFFKQVREALDEDYLLRIVFLMREDYIAELDPYVSFLPGNLRVRTRLERLDHDAALDAVVKPLQFTTRRFGEGVAGTLVQNLMRSSNGRPGVEQFVEAVQLQVVCQSLWQSLEPEASVITQEHLEKCGDVDHALMSFYEKSIRSIVGEDGLVDGNQRITEGDLRRWFEKVLITPEKKRATVDRREKQTGGMPNNTVVVPLELVQLIKGEWRAGARWYELSHDRFIDPILTSNQKWLEGQSVTEQIHQRLENRAAEYAQGAGGLLNEDELLEAKHLLAHESTTHITPSLRHLYQTSLIPEQKRKLRLMRLAVAAAVIVVALMGLLTTWAGLATRAAVRERRAAEDERKKAVAATEKAIQSKDEADKSKNEADTALKRAKAAELEAKNESYEAQKATADAVEARKEAEAQKDLAEDRGDLLEDRVYRDRQLNIADSWNRYAFGLSAGNAYKEALKAHETALKQYGELKDLTGEANTLTYIARVYSSLARSGAEDKEANFATAEKYYRQAIEIQKQISPDSNELARVINSLGSVIDSQDNPAKEAEALNLYQQALTLRTNIYDNNRSEIEPSFYTEFSNNYRYIGGVHQENGEYRKAMENAMQARDIANQAPVEKLRNASLADSLNLIALIDYFQGKYTDAEQLYKQAVLINEATRGPESPQLATNLHNLGLLYFQQAKYKEAEKSERAALEILRKATSIDHDSFALSYATLGRIYSEVGNTAAAEKNFQDAIDEMTLVKGENGRRVGIMKHYQAEFLLSQGKLQQAEKIEREVLSSFHQGFAPDHWYVSRSESTLAEILTAQGKYADAESLYTQALGNLKAKLGADHPEVATTQTGLAKLYIAEARYSDAEPLLKAALAIRERIEPNHPYTADVLEAYSTLLQRTGRETEAKEANARAQAIRQKVRAAYEVAK